MEWDILRESKAKRDRSKPIAKGLIFRSQLICQALKVQRIFINEERKNGFTNNNH